MCSWSWMFVCLGLKKILKLVLTITRFLCHELSVILICTCVWSPNPTPPFPSFVNFISLHLASHPYFQHDNDNRTVLTLWLEEFLFFVAQVPAHTRRKGNVQKLQGRQEFAPECWYLPSEGTVKLQYFAGMLEKTEQQNIGTTKYSSKNAHAQSMQATPLYWDLSLYVPARYRVKLHYVILMFVLRVRKVTYCVCTMLVQYTLNGAVHIRSCLQWPVA